MSPPIEFELRRRTLLVGKAAAALAVDIRPATAQPVALIGATRATVQRSYTDLAMKFTRSKPAIALASATK